MNQFILLGKLISKPVLDKNAPEKAPYKIVIKSDKEKTPIYIWEGLLLNVDKYPLDTMIAAKGTLKMHNGRMYAVCERCSFVTKGD